MKEKKPFVRSIAHVTRMGLFIATNALCIKEVQKIGIFVVKQIPIITDTQKSGNMMKVRNKKMLKVYCDICCKQLKDDYSNVINLNFNCYGVAKFDEPKTYNLCKKCAIEVREYLGRQTDRVPKSEDEE